MWAASIVTRARKEGRIRDDFAVKTIIDEINRFRGQCGLLLNYDTISVPLVYTQVRVLVLNFQTVCKFLRDFKIACTKVKIIVGLSSFDWRVEFFLLLKHYLKVKTTEISADLCSSFCTMKNNKNWCFVQLSDCQTLKQTGKFLHLAVTHSLLPVEACSFPFIDIIVR